MTKTNLILGAGAVVAVCAAFALGHFTRERAFVLASVEENLKLDALEQPTRARADKAENERGRLRRLKERVNDDIATLERVTAELKKTAADAEAKEQAEEAAAVVDAGTPPPSDPSDAGSP